MQKQYLLPLLLPLSVNAQTSIEIATTPTVIFSNHPFELQTIYVQSRTSCIDKYQHTVTVDGFDIDVELNLADDADSGTCAELDPMPTLVALTSSTLGPLPGGMYTVTSRDVDRSNEYTSQLYIYQASGEFAVQFNAETPKQDQVVSGVGVIRGWVCSLAGNSPRVEYQIDGTGPLYRLPYGSSRPDTNSVCSSQSDSNTGYGGVVNWNIYGAGEHTFTLFVNGIEVKSTRFVVAPSKGEFLRGLEGRSVIENFPEVGDTTVVEWSEADQNFKIIDVY
ncbi:hypothetical protein [uncultured Pseudoteredinibacter sp.]|uniref:hypothetical protein n=1 Tax=uncultured Pseudoteredinibacter sp. TaxID=1641701 RepID=UPI0026239228|nr:hypothetical protein [uncultured Pseudoteredinibacter sp.]